MTEDEAKVKWCPFAQSRVVVVPLSEGRQAISSFGLEPVPESTSTSCLASACMAWRWEWDDTKVKRVTNTGGGEYFIEIGQPLREGQTAETSCTLGFCGLAGSRFPDAC